MLSAKPKIKVAAPSIANAVQIQYFFPRIPGLEKIGIGPGYRREVIHKNAFRNGATTKTVIAVSIMGIEIESASVGKAPSLSRRV